MGHTIEQKCCDSGTFWVYLLVIVGLLLFSGLMSGLTLGLMSLGLVDLEVIKRSGKPGDRKHAEKIVPVVRRQHLLLVTLLVGNAMAMEALPLFLDSLVDTWVAILLSVTLLLMFGEILPQAVCSRYGLAVGAAMAPVVRVLLVIMFPIAWPVSKLLDKLLGNKDNGLFGRAELKTLVDMHGNEAGNGGELSCHETRIIAGTLELAAKTAGDAMTPIAAMVSIDVQSKLDDKMIMSIVASGFSRIPVYSGKPNNVVGLILVKNFLNVMVDKSSKLPIIDVPIRQIPRVSDGMPLHDVLHEFHQGRSHMAAVVKSTNSFQSDKESKESNREGVAIDVQTEAKYVESVFKTVIKSTAHNDEERSSNNCNGRTLKPGVDGNRVHRRLASWRGGEEEAGDVVVGIITREDVLEELLKEDTLDDGPECKVVDQELTKVSVSITDSTLGTSNTSLSTHCYYYPPTLVSSQLPPPPRPRQLLLSIEDARKLQQPSVSSSRPNTSASPAEAALLPAFTDFASESFRASPPDDIANRATIVMDLPPTSSGSSSTPGSPIRGIGAKPGAQSMSERTSSIWNFNSGIGSTPLSNLTSRVLLQAGQESPRAVSRQVAVHRILR